MKLKRMLHFCAHRTHLILFFILMILIGGCGNGAKKYIRPNVDVGSIRKIAVMPLENLTSSEFANEKISSLLIMELLSRGIDVMEPGEVMNSMRSLGIRQVRAIPADDIRRLGEEMKVDSVITGAVGSFQIRKGISVSYPDVSVHFMMMGVKTGDIIWSSWNTSAGPDFWTRHFGAEGATLDETAQTVVKGALDTLF